MIKATIRKLLGLAGLELRKIPKPDAYRKRGGALMPFIRERRINVLLDIGANLGPYARALRESGFDGRMISFEPLTEQFSLLEKRCANDKAWEAHRCAVGDEDREIEINVAGNSESSSILPMLDLHAKAAPDSAYVSRQIVPMRKLDSFLPPLLGKDDRLMMKMDVQGYEMKALQGASAVLSRVEIIDVELSLSPLYAGQPTFVEMVAFLESKGFVPISIENAFTDPRNGHALQVDAVFAQSGA